MPVHVLDFVGATSAAVHGDHGAPLAAHSHPSAHGHDCSFYDAASAAPVNSRGRALADFLAPCHTLGGAGGGSRGARALAASFLQGPSDGAAALAAGASLPGRGAARRHFAAMSSKCRWDSDATSFFLADTRATLVEVLRALPPAVIVPMHAASIVVAMPGHLLIELGEGYLFGFRRGLALALAGKSLGVTAAFCLARAATSLWNFPEMLNKQMEAWPRARGLASQVEAGGFVSVLLLTLAPVPCVVKNYSLALLTTIPFSVYIPAKLVGLLPTTAAHVYAGTLAPSVADLGGGLEATMHMMAAGGVLAGAAALSALCGYYLHSRSPPLQLKEPVIKAEDYDDTYAGYAKQRVAEY